MPKIKEDKLLGPEYLQNLKKPKKGSRKGDNGKLLIIGGSETYHGAPILSVMIASRIVDLVYFFSVKKNVELAKKMKLKIRTFINPSEKELEDYVEKVDAILIGPGLEKSKNNEVMINWLLHEFKDKKFILDAGAFDMIKPRLLNKNCILTPHTGEFKKFFGKEADKKNVKALAKKHNCVIALKGSTDLIAGPKEFMINKSGNPGMTKGGTGDILAGLIAGLACTNELFTAAAAGIFINGMAGDRLAKTRGTYYSAEDLLNEIPRTIKWCQDLKLN
ncbi:NAD(P)H-hydrate dehydratase [Candidatus Falkowbacteria bacterium]|nr:NAD(P)H-hydrate dehydratase [Candidatus Falkowbacteria bacterium]